jgi:hypothetical protein
MRFIDSLWRRGWDSHRAGPVREENCGDGQCRAERPARYRDLAGAGGTRRSQGTRGRES